MENKENKIDKVIDNMVDEVVGSKRLKQGGSFLWKIVKIAIPIARIATIILLIVIAIIAIEDFYN